MEGVAVPAVIIAHPGARDGLIGGEVAPDLPPVPLHQEPSLVPVLIHVATDSRHVTDAADTATRHLAAIGHTPAPTALLQTGPTVESAMGLLRTVAIVAARVPTAVPHPQSATTDAEATLAPDHLTTEGTVALSVDTGTGSLTPPAGAPEATGAGPGHLSSPQFVSIRMVSQE